MTVRREILAMILIEAAAGFYTKYDVGLCCLVRHVWVTVWCASVLRGEGREFNVMCVIDPSWV